MPQLLSLWLRSGFRLAGFYKRKLKVVPQGALAALIGGGVIGLLGKIPGLDIPLKGDLPLLGFAVSAIPLFGVSFIKRKSGSILLGLKGYKVG